MIFFGYALLLDMHDDILSGFIGVVVKTQFLLCRYTQNKKQNKVELKLHFETIQIKEDMKLRIFSRTIISTSIDLPYNCNSVSNDCGILGIDFHEVVHICNFIIFITC